MTKKNTKDVAADQSPYINEEPSATKKANSVLSKPGLRIGAIVAGGTLALGAAFGIGLTVGHAQGPDFGRDQFGQAQFDQHGGPGAQRPQGGFDRDGDHGGQFNPNGMNGQTQTDPNATTPNTQTN